MKGVFEQRAHIGVFHRLPRIHDHHVLRNLGYNAQVVRYQDDGGVHFLFQLAQQLQNLRLNGHVQGGGGLIGNQDGRVTGKRHGDHHALAHAAGQLVGIVVDDLFGRGDAHLFEHFNALFAGLLFVQPLMHLERFADLLAHGEYGVKRGKGLLKNHGDFVSTNFAHFLFGLFQEALALVEDIAADNFAGGRGENAQYGQRGDGLSAAGFAHDGKGASVLQGKAQPVHRRGNALFGVEVCF